MTRGIMSDNVGIISPAHFPYVELDESVVMPKHVHGIVVIVGAPLVGALSFVTHNTETRAGSRPAPTRIP